MTEVSESVNALIYLVWKNALGKVEKVLSEKDSLGQTQRAWADEASF